jgi:hypothetical protein
VAEEFAPVGYSNLNAPELLYAIGTHFTAEYLEHTDLDRFVRRYIHAVNRVGTLKRRGPWRTGDQQDNRSEYNHR